MLTDQTNDLVKRLRAGESVGAPETAFLEQLGADEFLTELNRSFPIQFQYRSINQKREFGLAAKVSILLDTRFSSGHLLPSARFTAVLRNCLFVSFYDDSVSEITTVERIRVIPTWKPAQGLKLRTGCGQKLDKTVDGWVQKPIDSRDVKLSEGLLLSRGWKVDIASLVRTR